MLAPLGGTITVAICCDTPLLTVGVPSYGTPDNVVIVHSAGAPVAIAGSVLHVNNPTALGPGSIVFTLGPADLPTVGKWVVLVRTGGGDTIGSQEVEIFVGASASPSFPLGVARPGFTFTMLSATTGLPLAGLSGSLTHQVCIDGAPFVSTTNPASEVSNGLYTINLSASDLNGKNIVLLFTGAGCKPTIIYIGTI